MVGEPRRVVTRVERGFAVAVALWIASISAWALYGVLHGVPGAGR